MIFRADLLTSVIPVPLGKTHRMKENIMVRVTKMKSGASAQLSNLEQSLDKIVDSPHFSVVTVSLNDQKGLKSTLRSVARQQALGGFEHIVVDGGSSYDVASVVSFENRNAILVSEMDEGIYDGMNKGINLSTGEYLIFLNSGDIFADDQVLLKVEAAADASEPDFIFGDANEQLTTGKIIVKSAKNTKKAPFGMITHHQAMFFRRELIVKKGLTYNLNYPLAGDYDFFLRFIKVSRGNLKVDFPICVFGQGGISYKNWHTARREQFQIRRRIYGSIAFAAVLYTLQLVMGYIRRWFPNIHSYIRGR